MLAADKTFWVKPLKQRPDMLIFDCDGVLVDSETVSCTVLADALSGEGLKADANYVKRHFLGRSLKMVRLHAQAQGVALSPEFEARFSKILLARFQEELQPMSGVVELLDEWGGLVCVASSSHLERVRLCLQVTGLAAYFGEHIFTAELVRHGKPAPDLFLYAARQMQVVPAKCLVLEDSPSGVQAACSAGMEVWGFTGGAHHGGSQHAVQQLKQAGAPFVLDNMKVVAAALGLSVH